jgi:hypothetical protein
MHQQQRQWDLTGQEPADRFAPIDRRVAELQAALNRVYGWPRTIRDVARRPSLYSTSFKIEELDVSLEDGTRLELICKNLGRAALLPEARRVRPDFLYAPLREIRVYEHVLSAADIGTAACYGTHCDADADYFLLFLERVRSAKLCHVGDFAVWTRVARWLGAWHATVVPRATRDRVPLLRYDEAYYHRWLNRAATNVGKSADHGGGVTAAAARRDLAWLAGRYGELARALAGLPRTLIHGEFYPSNVLIAQTQQADGDPAARARVCPVDWEMAALAPGAVDLAALVSGRWTAEQREVMAMAYYDELAKNTPAAAAALPSRTELLRSLDYCRLHLAVQWVGWSADWSPPADQAWDWLREAADAGRALGW